MSRHRFHGATERFRMIADFIADRFGDEVTYIADVAGGQGLLSRLLCKKYNYVSEVVDPRGWVLRGVDNHAQTFDADFADYYDLIVGLHPDQATRAIAHAALRRPALLVPCCNFWSSEKLGRDALVAAIETFYAEHEVECERVTFDFSGPNVGLVTRPPASA